jgi:hypothetical protein
MCDGVGNQQLAPEGSTQGKVSFVQTQLWILRCKNMGGEIDRERERENRSVGIKLDKRVYLCGLLIKRTANVDVVHVCLSELLTG